MLEQEVRDYVGDLIKRAKAAQKVAEAYTQEEARHIANCIGWLALNKAEEWAEFNFQETGMGDVQSKINRTQSRARGMVNLPWNRPAISTRFLAAVRWAASSAQ